MAKLHHQVIVSFEVYKNAKKKYPEKKVSLVYIPTEEETVPLL
jgi:hypothetical protein